MTVREDYERLHMLAGAVVETWSDGNLAHAVGCLGRYLDDNKPEPPANQKEAKEKILARNFIRKRIQSQETPARYARLLGQLGALDRDGLVQFAGLLQEITIGIKAENVNTELLAAVYKTVENFDRDPGSIDKGSNPPPLATKPPPSPSPPPPRKP